MCAFCKAPVFGMQVLESYAASIRLGHRHIYKSLPRLLTLWYDFGTQALASRDQKVQL